jgi:RNA polymerase sigma-70 factor (ECF subfamily)
MEKDQINPEIVRLAQAGDIEAFEKILSHYEKAIFHFVSRIVQNDKDAEDITQETFIKVYFKIKKFKSEYKFSTWLFAIAKNTINDWFRKHKKRELLIIDDPDKPFETYYLQEKYVERYSGIQLKIDIESAISKIKPIYKTVLTMFYNEGYAYRDISEKMSLPLNTVKTYIYRAKCEMRKELQHGDS